MYNQSLKEVAGISIESRAWAKIIKDVISQHREDTYIPPKFNYDNSRYGNWANFFNKSRQPEINENKPLTVEEFEMMDQDDLDDILDSLVLYYNIDYDEFFDMDAEMVVSHYNLMIDDNPLFEQIDKTINEPKKYEIDGDNIIIDGKNFPEAYENFSVDKWVIGKSLAGAVEYDHINSGYNEDGQYVVYLNVGISPSLSVLNHEIKHSFQDWNRISTGHPPIRDSKELQQLYTKDFERYIITHPVGRFDTLEGLIKGYYFTSSPEITAYLEGEYDQMTGDLDRSSQIKYSDIANVLINVKVEDVESKTKPKNLQKKWDKILKDYEIPFFRKFKDVNEFIKYTVKFFNRRGRKILHKINKMKYVHRDEINR